MGIYGALAVVVVGLGLLLSGFQRPRRPRRLGRRVSLGVYRIVLGLLLTVVGLLFLMLAMNLRPFVRLTEKNAVAEVTVKSLYPVAKTYSVKISRLDGPRYTTTCILKGDHWAVGGAAQSWDWWVIGLAKTYTLHRIVGGTAASDKPFVQTTVCNVDLPQPKLNPYLPGSLTHGLIDLAMAGERALDTKKAMPLTDGAVYRVLVDADGFSAETTFTEP